MPVVRHVFEMIAKGSPLHVIKTTLDREGVPTPRGNSPWNKITIRRYLLSDIYKPHTVEELRTLGVAADVLDRLDPEKRYGVWWFGVDRTARIDEPKKRRDGQQRAKASSKPRQFKKQEDADHRRLRAPSCETSRRASLSLGRPQRQPDEKDLHGDPHK